MSVLHVLRRSDVAKVRTGAANKGGVVCRVSTMPIHIDTQVIYPLFFLYWRQSFPSIVILEPLVLDRSVAREVQSMDGSTVVPLLK